MIIFPAIDLKDGQCVRLFQGEFDKVTVFNHDPAAQAKSFEDMGFSYLHLVDLNGALEGKPVNESAVESIIKRISLPIQLGGGIRTIATIERWLTMGITRVILGTIALHNPDLVKEACRLFPGQIVVGIDGRGGKVAIQGWAETSEVTVIELAQKFEDAGVSAIVYTDISRDGTLTGPDLEGTKTLAKSISIPVIVSGGMSKTDDISAVKAMEHVGIEGVIIGRALYDKKIDVPRALQIANG
ncbi:MAG: 1-(5-phosphoribosyl)-5-[(5-phosphoribosylamino)methylideneamino]imidazole-4-carboxamide isomerase [Alphaproteobacteria bacterium]|nr:1-(5-phosphoribosyl)-5-[(5-phosphoribosylamino)methylideneamino]imidazole-4-carboxamide isomerase [Alphaproteobacteria bacterium]